MNRILVHPQDNRRLRKKAKRVENPQSTEAILAVQTMKRLALDWEQRHPGQLCAGLAATQIGVPLRIVIIRSQAQDRAPQNPDMLENNTEVYKTEQEYLDARAEYREWKNGPGYNYDPFLVMYNPVYGESEGMQDSEEGCPSVPYAEGETVRPEKCTFHYYDHNLRRQPATGHFVAEGLSAAVICHELDHLRGVLYIDSALRVWEPGSKPKDEETGVDAKREALAELTADAADMGAYAVEEAAA